MANIIVYDKVSWHYPEGENCPNLEAAKLHFSIAMKWLKENDLLSDEGKEIFEIGIDADSSLTSSMLNEKGNFIIKNYYSIWLKTLNYSTTSDCRILDDGLRKYKSSQ